MLPKAKTGNLMPRANAVVGVGGIKERGFDTQNFNLEQPQIIFKWHLSAFITSSTVFIFHFFKKPRPPLGFSGDRVAETPCSLCRGPGFDPESGNYQ